jgi:hypothetical protein
LLPARTRFSPDGYQLERPSSGRSRSRSASLCFTDYERCRNINLLSIAYALRPRLRPDLPAADCPGSGSLGYSAVGVLAPRIVTHPDIRTRPRSAPASADASPLRRRSPTTHPLLNESRASAHCLAPVYCRRRVARPVSCYALFQGWLLLSQPPGCFGDPTSLPTEQRLGGLSGGSGLLPF